MAHSILYWVYVIISCTGVRQLNDMVWVDKLRKIDQQALQHFLPPKNHHRIYYWNWWIIEYDELCRSFIVNWCGIRSVVWDIEIFTGESRKPGLRYEFITLETGFAVLWLIRWQANVIWGDTFIQIRQSLSFFMLYPFQQYYLFGVKSVRSTTT